ncbi:MAG TPA: HD domain-containing protein [Fibrobacteria bacterium]|nr:HD domain-containing protein [Fibrobacteria bacterium]
MTESDRSRWEARFVAFLERDGAFGDAAHDLEHVRRVVRTAMSLAVPEGADPDIVFAAAWLHDCVAVPKDSPDRSKASRFAAAAASEFLAAAGWESRQIPFIHHAIEAHSFSAGIEPITPDARVVQDADRLDALGAHGLARCIATGASMGTGLVHPTDPWAVNRALDDVKWSVDHFFAKLFKLPAMMRTAAGRAEADRRSEVLKVFLRELARERGEPSPV